MDPDVRKELDALQKRVKELEKKERQSKQALSRLSRSLNTINKFVKSLKVKVHSAEYTLNAIKNSMRNMG